MRIAIDRPGERSSDSSTRSAEGQAPASRDALGATVPRAAPPSALVAQQQIIQRQTTPPATGDAPAAAASPAPQPAAAAGPAAPVGGSAEKKAPTFEEVRKAPTPLVLGKTVEDIEKLIGGRQYEQSGNVDGTGVAQLLLPEFRSLIAGDFEALKFLPQEESTAAELEKTFDHAVDHMKKVLARETEAVVEAMIAREVAAAQKNAKAEEKAEGAAKLSDEAKSAIAVAVRERLEKDAALKESVAAEAREATARFLAGETAKPLCYFLSAYLYYRAIGRIDAGVSFVSWYSTQLRMGHVGVVGSGGLAYGQSRGTRQESGNLTAYPTIEALPKDARLAISKQKYREYTDKKGVLQYSNHYLLIARGSDDVWRNLDHTSTAEQWSGGKTDPERVLKVWCDPGVPAAAPAEKPPARSPAAPAAAAAPAGALQSSGARQLLQCVDAWNEPDEQQSIPQASVQREAARGAAATLDPALIQEAGRLGTSGAGRPLPFLEKLQRAFGRHDLSGVVAHSDSAAAAGARAMGAEAFTTGDHVAFAREPALATAAHEAAHVVQQRAGVQLPGGVGRVGDEHERHADVVAARVVAGQSSEDLLDRYMGGAQPAGQVDAVQAQEGEPELKHYEKKQVYSYTESGAVRWIDAFKIDFLKGSGFDLLLSARKKGYTTFGALFIIAHATLESGWGKGNWADTTHNLFSLMGGSDKKYKTAHGTLAKYADVSQAFDAYLAQLAKADRWPTTVAAGTGLYYQESFTPDDVNKAFRQKDYYAKGGYPYNADPASDYGDVLFDRMRWLAGPLIVLIGQIIAAAPAGSENAKLLPGYLTELQAAYSNVAARLAAHRKPAAKASAPVQRAMAPTPEPGAAGSRLPR